MNESEVFSSFVVLLLISSSIFHSPVVCVSCTCAGDNDCFCRLSTLPEINLWSHLFSSSSFFTYIDSSCYDTKVHRERCTPYVISLMQHYFRVTETHCRLKRYFTGAAFMNHQSCSQQLIFFNIWLI